MRTLRILGLIVLSASLHAQVRTFVSATIGSDANDCSRSLPCRNFAAAITAVAAGGEVVVLDSGGYGAVTITKGVAVISPFGIHAGIAPTVGDAIVVNAPGATVRIRNLFLVAHGSGVSGIRISAGNLVLVEGCSARAFRFGIFISPTVDTLAPVIRDCVFHDGLDDGISIQSNMHPLAVLVEDTLLANNAETGLIATSNGVVVRVDARNVTSIRNPVQFQFTAFGIGDTLATLESCTIVGSLPIASTGIATDTFSLDSKVLVRVSNSTVTGNSIGLSSAGVDSFIHGRGNNTVEGNNGGETFDVTFSGK